MFCETGLYNVNIYTPPTLSAFECWKDNRPRTSHSLNTVFSRSHLQGLPNSMLLQDEQMNPSFEKER